MADNPLQGTGAGMPARLDLSQFYQIFFDEATENLDQMEHMLLHVDLAHANDEQLNAIFRCAHSIKGGAATFGFTDIAELTHHMESLLDRVRRRDVTLQSDLVELLLQSADVSRDLLAAHRNGKPSESPASADLAQRIAALLHGAPTAPQPATGTQQGGAASGEAVAGMRCLQLLIGPAPAVTLEDVLDLLHSQPGITVRAAQPAVTQTSGEGVVSALRQIDIETAQSDATLRDLLAFHLSESQLQIQRAVSPASAAAATPGAAPDSAPQEDDFFGLFLDAPGAPADQAHDGRAPDAPLPTAAQSNVTGTLAEPARPVSTPSFEHRASSAAAAEAATVRVSVQKVDQLINLVGELVITQAMLAQNSRGIDVRLHQQLLAGLSDLERNTRELQESVMSIRMIPMSVIFNRFPRMLRDLALKCGKNVELVTLGEATELDKSLIEKITDPLTHLVRNSCDHGIETPAERVAAGKPEHGTITLSASHQGGSIMIEVHDDGRGLSRDKILNKARERGLHVSGHMTDMQVWALVFEPGFSTADVVTDISGRGVGMDVVNRSITSLGGSVELDSAEGYGTRVSVRLPLTLAIMDGMSVRVGDEVYILPLSAVMESFQTPLADVNSVAEGTPLVKVRDEYLPVVDLAELFDVPRAPAHAAVDSAIMVVVDVEDQRVALQVDELLGQHQVVVKNLETNYRKVPNVAGATIMGDGSVALILDADAIVRHARGARRAGTAQAMSAPPHWGEQEWIS